jgi:hypothetical protein
MATLDQFDAWARRAAREEVPVTDVAGPVLARLSQAEEPDVAFVRWLWGATAATACAAAVCAAVGYLAWSEVAVLSHWFGWARDFQMGWSL